MSTLINKGFVPQTQKARGLIELSDKVAKLNNTTTKIMFHVPHFLLIQDDLDIENLRVEPGDYSFSFPPISAFPAFVRPCPTTPMHGFVDSRVATSLDEVKAIWEEARAADPAAELVIMKPIPAYLSAILTPSTLSLGEGTDGATQGKEGTITLHVTQGGLASSYDTISDTPYVEILYTPQGPVYAVQLRDGLPVPETADYIPEPMRVEHIISPADFQDLWDAWKLAVEGASPGTVAWLPGSNLSSHYAVHALGQRMPVLTTFKPEVGQELVPTAGDSEPDPAAFLSGYNLALAIDLDSAELDKELALAAAVLHSAIPLVRNKTGTKLVGWACGTLVRLTSVACAGEWRYALKAGKKGKINRHRLYQKYLNWKLARRSLRRWQRGFVYGNFPGSSYGGKRWAYAAQQAIRLHNLAVNSNINSAVSIANDLLHIAHNSGWLFDKFAKQHDLYLAANYSGLQLAKHGREIYALLSSGCELDKKLIAPINFSFSDLVEEPSSSSEDSGSDNVELGPATCISVQVRLLTWEVMRVQAKFRYPSGKTVHKCVDRPIPNAALSAAILDAPDAGTDPSYFGTKKMYTPVHLLVGMGTPTLYIAKQPAWESVVRFDSKYMQLHTYTN